MICVYKMCSTAFDWSITSAIATLIRKWNASWQSHAMTSFNGSLKVHMTLPKIIFPYENTSE